MKIFSIDDERASLFFLAKAVKEVCPNDEYYEFDNYEDFIDEFKKELPDVAFLDVEMPEITGIDLAREIIKIKSNVNIIFVTAYSNYALDAFSVNASSYIVKPANKEKVLNALNNLRYDIEGKDIVIKTFGNFDVFYKGNPVSFRSEKSKEVLAYLIDREGGIVPKKELSAAIYEEDYTKSIQAILSRNIKYLEEDLESVGIKDFLKIGSGEYSVDIKNCSCDLIDFLNGNKELFIGEYMEQYSWAEFKKANLENMK